MPLLPHQIEGKDFLLSRKRVMLCDTMGLGKTVQAIYALKEGNLRSIIFAPRPLLKQWKNEIERFSGLEPIIIRGSVNDRMKQYIKKKDVYLLNYEKADIDIKYLKQFRKIDCIILDEAQRIKNFKAKRTLAIKDIVHDLNANYRWILTGTPIENRISELYSLLEFLNGDAIQEVSNNIAQKRNGGWKGYTYFRPGMTGPPSRQLFMNAIRNQTTEDVYKALETMMLRRVYNEDDIPPPSVKTYYLEMDSKQWRIHQEFLTEMKAYIQNDSFEVTNALSQLTRLRQVANTPQLINPSYTRLTPKLMEILAIAQDMISSDQKVVFFSEFRKMTNLVSTFLKKEGIKHSHMHGGSNCNSDQEKENFINDQYNHILLATKTGEEGHNLQIAHHIVNIELPYNPARIGQRIGRCHRIGQANTVRVINLISEGSIEEKILDIIYEKERLFNDIINVHSKEVSLNREMIRNITK